MRVKMLPEAHRRFAPLNKWRPGGKLERRCWIVNPLTGTTWLGPHNPGRKALDSLGEAGKAKEPFAISELFGRRRVCQDTPRSRKDRGMPVISRQPLRAHKPTRPRVDRVVLAAPASADAMALTMALRHAGFTVYRAGSVDQIRRLLDASRATAAVLATELGDETGWLMCAKLQWSHPDVRVLLFGPETPSRIRLARFVGADALLADADAVAAWLDASSQRTEVRVHGADL